MQENIILFDLDGTLIDSTVAIVSTFRHTFTTMDFDFKGDDEDIKSTIGYPLDIMFEMLGVEKSRAFDFVAVYKQRYSKISKSQTTLLPKAFEALQEASSFARLGIVTTKAGNATRDLLEHLGISDFFEVVTGRDDVINPKPHPEPIFKTLNLMKVDTTNPNIFMIGDTKLDLIAAYEANIQSVAVLCGYGKKDVLKLHTTNITQDPLEATRLIKQKVSAFK